MRDGMRRGAAFIAALALMTGAPNSGMLAGRLLGLRQGASAPASTMPVLQGSQLLPKRLWAGQITG